jgi:eukaryotic-like serine/threonine-protein kinase
VICSSCGNLNAEDAHFCHRCGKTLSGHNETEVQVSSVKPDPMLGRSIDNRYRLDSLIGVGGMGTVYRATRVLIGDEVAIKILHTDHRDASSSERFQREAQAAARLKHPNAVSIYDFGVSADGLQYLVMELLEGESLRERMGRGLLALAEVAEISSQVCAALDEAHRRQIVHRDIKPDNIILESTANGFRVKVLDFGIAKLRDDTASHLTKTGSVMGTPHYMSPEQCLGEELDSRADVYSVGIVVYEMLCGRVPFQAPVSTAVVVQHVSQPPPSLRSINPAIPQAVEDVVLHAIQKSREARPATAGKLAHELTAALFGQRVPASGYSQFQAIGSSAEVVNEETVERGRLIAESSSSLPKTIHLASPGLGVPAVQGRLTAADRGAVTANFSRPFPLKYVVAAIILLAAGASSVFVVFKLTSQNNNVETANTNPHGPTTPSGAQTSTTNAAATGVAAKPATPSGMVAIEGGEFRMGNVEGDTDSKPVHLVSVKPFYLDAYEVTCEQFKQFVDKTGRPAPKDWVNGTYPPGSGKHPVTNITWEDAVAYARWLGKRLPSEEEWEFAARGRTGLRYPWGNAWRQECANAGEDGASRNGLADVGSYGCGSPFGVYDLIGNAWEWTASDWKPYPGGRLATPPNPGDKVIRGGSWETKAKFATTTYRAGYTGIGNRTGFRCARDIP